MKHRLWNLADPTTEPIRFTGHEFGVASVAFSPDGQTLASGSDDNILLWPEWQKYLPGQPHGCTCPALPPHWTVLENVEEGVAEIDKTLCDLYP